MTSYAQNKWYAQKGYAKRAAAEATRAAAWDRWNEGLRIAEIASTLNMRHEGYLGGVWSSRGVRASPLGVVAQITLARSLTRSCRRALNVARISNTLGSRTSWAKAG
jgi:hypothetical protein